MSLPEPFDRSTFKQSDSHHLIDPLSAPRETLDTQQVCDWQEQLLPVATLRNEEDVTVLRQQLEAAHQLLHYRQNLADSLTEQLISGQTHLAQAERDLEEAQQECARQADKVDDVQSVCQDLRSQLRRQQQRIGEYKQILKQTGTLPSTVGQLATQQGFVALNYDSLGGAPVDDEAAKATPVAPWSAGAADLAGPLTIYRKLAEMTMATAAARSQQKMIQKRAEPPTFDAEDYRFAGHRIELPSFT